MPRCLTVQRTLVTPPDREKFAVRLERKYAHYAQAGCKYTVFEETGLPGAFLEFFEAPDAKTLNDLADRARTKRLKPEEVQQATFTITNPGVFGSLMGTPIIPLGTSAILGLGAIEKRPKVIAGTDGEDTIAIRTCAYFSLSFDHRIVDGADADRFLAAVKAGLESFPETAL